VKSVPCDGSWTSRAKAIVLCGMLGPVAWWPNVNYIPNWDSFIFETSGWFITQGLVPYRDFWDHKPPGIHVLDAFVVAAAGDAWPGFEMLQVVNAFVLAAAFAACVLASGCGTVATAGGTLLMTLAFYAPEVYQGGNRAEEFGATLVILGLALRQAGGGRSGLAAAACLGAAPFFKEPFIFSIAPWVGADVWARLAAPPRRIRAVTAYLCAAATPGLLAVAWLAWAGGLCGWLDALAYNLFSYGERQGLVATLVSNIRPFLTHTTGLLLITGPLFIGGLLAASRGATAAARRGMPLLGAQVACEFVATAIGGRHTETYYLQSIPAFMAIVALGIDAVVRVEWPPLERVSDRGRSVAAIGLAVLASAMPLAMLVRGYAERPRRWPGNADIAMAIREMSGADARIWVPAVYRTDVYRLADRMPATRYFYIPGAGQGMNAPRGAGLGVMCCVDHPTRGAEMEAELRANGPDAIVLDGFSVRAIEAASATLLPWIEERYAPERRFPAINGHVPVLLVPRKSAAHHRE